MAPKQSKPRAPEELEVDIGTNGHKLRSRLSLVGWMGFAALLLAMTVGHAFLSGHPSADVEVVDRPLDEANISKLQGAELFKKSVAPWFDEPFDLSPLAKGRPHFHQCERLSAADAAANPMLIVHNVYEASKPLILTDAIDIKRHGRKTGAALQKQILRGRSNLKVDVSVDWSLDFQRPTANGTLLHPAGRTETLAAFFDLVQNREQALKLNKKASSTGLLQEAYNIGQQEVPADMLHELGLQQPPLWMEMICGAAPFGQCGKLQLWMATHGKRSLLHFDKMDNALLQVVGSKRIRLVDALRMDSVYPSVLPREHIESPGIGRFDRRTDNESYGSDNFAPLRLDDDNISALFPRFDQNIVTHCILEPGEMLLLPAYWWHDVLNEAPPNDKLPLNIAVNLWFEPQRVGRVLLDGLAYNFFRLSHAWSEMSHKLHPLIKEHRWRPPKNMSACSGGRPAFSSFDWTFVEKPGSEPPAVVDGTLEELESPATYTIVWWQSRPMLLLGKPPTHWHWPSEAKSKPTGSSPPTADTIIVHSAPDNRFDAPYDGVLRRALRAPLGMLPPGWPHDWNSFKAKEPALAMPPPLSYFMPGAEAVEEFGEGPARFAWHYSPRVRAMLLIKGALKIRLVDFIRSSSMQVERLQEADLQVDGSLRFTGRTIDNFSSCRSCAKHGQLVQFKVGMLLLVPAHWWLSWSTNGPWKLVTWTARSEDVFTSRVVEFLAEKQWAQACHNVSQ